MGRKMSKEERRELRLVKKAALIRDGIKCDICNARKRLQVHHLNSWRYYPKIRFTLSNLITLCRGCHTMIHTNFKRSYRVKVTKYDYDNFKVLAKYFSSIR